MSEDRHSSLEYPPASNPHDGGEALARGLGWFSIALGTAELVAPGTLARALGMEEKEGLIRAFGVREIATGFAILSSSDPAPWVWARVGGDALDIAALARGLDADNPKKGNVEIALAAVAGVAALDFLCGRRLRGNGATMIARDYGNRSGLPLPPEQMRGVARDFPVPPDMRTPEAMRAYTAS
jgi:hypothetical protein